MLRYIKHNLTGIDDVAIYPIFSLLIFFVFFFLVIAFVVRMKKPEIDMLSAIPFDDAVEKDDETKPNLD